ncbi:MAG: hypothetical protein LBC91_05295, partial [Candidatus Accumulibacter sp.]|nr:hypothetical protein [Accumulibacter sp.]
KVSSFRFPSLHRIFRHFQETRFSFARFCLPFLRSAGKPPERGGASVAPFLLGLHRFFIENRLRWEPSLLRRDGSGAGRLFRASPGFGWIETLSPEYPVIAEEIYTWPAHKTSSK